jgi:hypothetical protein
MDGTTLDFTMTAEEARAYAEVAAKDFGVGPDREGEFQISKMAEEIKEKKSKNKGSSTED